jgi:GNAT superfamily N-acetyltransferase
VIDPLAWTTDFKKCNRSLFDCGVPALNQYLNSQAGQDVRKNLAICYMVCREDTVVGFYTLSQHLIRRDDLPENEQKKLPKTYDAPATLIGRLGIDKSVQGQGVGKRVLMHALYKIYVGSKNSATYGAVVVTKDGAEDFYKKQGFILLKASEKKYFLPIKVIESAIPNLYRLK